MIRYIAVILLALLFFSACQKNVPEPQGKPYQVNLNPKSNHIMRANHEDGTVVDYFGKKDEVGRTEQIQMVRIQAKDKEQPDLLYFNEDSRLSRIMAADGSQYKFEWLDETALRLTATSKDNSEQVSIPIDLDEIGLQQPPRAIEERNLTEAP